MPKWKLTPKDLDHPDWENSTNKSPITVDAENETEARQIAASKYSVATLRRIGQDVKPSPWKNPALADCTELTE